MNTQIKNEIEEFYTNNDSIPLDFFDKKINENPNSVYIKLFQIYHLIRNENFELAVNNFNFLEKNENNLSYYKNFYFMLKALISLYRGDKDEAKFFFDSAIKCETNKNKWLRLELYYFYLDKEMYKAFGYLEEALNIDPNFYEAILEKVNWDDTDQNCSSIITLLEKIPTTYKESEVKSLLGIAYFNCFDTNKSIAILKKSISIKSLDENNFYLGYIYDNELEDYNKAEKFYKECLTINPNYEDCINSYAWMQSKLGNVKLAEEKFLRLIQLNRNQTSYDQIIQFYLEQNSFSLAKAEFYIKESKFLFENNFTNDGFYIIVQMLKGTDIKEEINKYFVKYSDFEKQWLKEMIVTYSR